MIEEVKKTFPNKPIGYLVNTHNHFDHLGGVRTYVAEGATVITDDRNRNFYQQVVLAPQDVQHSVLPDQKWTYRPMYKAKVLQPPRPEDVAEAAKIVAGAKQPTKLCGLGAAQGKAEPEVRQLAEYLGEIDKARAVKKGPVIVNVCINGNVELPVSWEIAQHLESTGE